MGNRLETLRNRIDKFINHDDIRMCISHTYGVAQFCTLLAMKRNMDVELATTCGMLHDIHWITGGSSDNHASKGAEQAKIILKAMNTYSDGEIELITTAILKHSDKKSVDEPYDELLKDADVMNHCLYNADFPIAKSELVRYKNLLREFDITHG
ncbi:MAG: HD domain-containing protein [Oscillospiraceae bacterium]|nr:HD domain-containing protein [Oscillospiraceae bacterium]